MAPLTPPVSALRAHWAWAPWLVLCLGCSGELVNLGSSELQAGGTAGASSGGGSAGGPVAPVWALQSDPVVEPTGDLLFANPTLKADLSELYYSAQERYGVDPPLAHVELATGDGFTLRGAITIDGLKPNTDVVSPAVSADATELWLGINTQWMNDMTAITGNTDVYHCVRQGDVWSTPTLVASLSDPDHDDAPRPPAVNGTIMPLSSKRHGGALYQIYLSTRTAGDPDAAWTEPSNALLGAINADDYQSADGFLDETGLELYFSSTRAGDQAHSDLYVARRASVTAPFGAPEPLVELNAPGASDERMPWLSPRGDKLFFASSRSGQFALYVATKL